MTSRKGARLNVKNAKIDENEAMGNITLSALVSWILQTDITDFFHNNIKTEILTLQRTKELKKKTLSWIKNSRGRSRWRRAAIITPEVLHKLKNEIISEWVANNMYNIKNQQARMEN